VREIPQLWDGPWLTRARVFAAVRWINTRAPERLGKNVDVQGAARCWVARAGEYSGCGRGHRREMTTDTTHMQPCLGAGSGMAPLAAATAYGLDPSVTFAPLLTTFSPKRPTRPLGRTASKRLAHRPARPGPGISAPRLPRTRRLDPEWRAWLEGLRDEGWARQAAIGRLYALLLREARHEVRRSTATLAHPSGRDLDDLSLQAADDALVAILGKLDQLRGDALFTTWARFDALEVPDKTRRRLGHTRETPTDADHWPPDPVSCEDPHACIEAVELARILAYHGIGPMSRWRWAGVELRES
jgi:hypothetical protein